jgi:deazaflavin-dependent oxidoreductase (nitroreductase family)
MSSAMSIRHVDPLARRSCLYRLHGGLNRTRLLRRLALTPQWGALLWPIDRVLLRLTGGRVSTAYPVATGLLQTRGARSGKPRATAVIYFHDGERVTIIASHAGRPSNPAWYHDALANPNVSFGGDPYRAERVEDPAAQERLWGLAGRVFPAFTSYRQAAARTGRTIPMLQLTSRPPVS